MSCVTATDMTRSEVLVVMERFASRVYTQRTVYRAIARKKQKHRSIRTYMIPDMTFLGDMTSYVI